MIRSALEFPAGSAADPLGPRGFPLLLGTGLLASGVALLIRSLRVPGRDAAVPQDEPVVDDTTSEEARLPYSWPRAVGAVAATGLFIVALIPLGALLASVAYALALLLVQGRPGRREALLTVIAFPLFVYVLVDVLLGVPLPPGPLAPVLRQLGI